MTLRLNATTINLSKIKFFVLGLLVLGAFSANAQEQSEHPIPEEQQAMIGQLAPDFELPDLEWSDVKLSDVDSKVILVDFWASWCRYCRFFNQEVSDLQAQYGDDGFQVISVSLDTDYYKWKRAMKADEISWISVNDRTGMDSETAKNYHIIQTPTTFLLNEKKEVIAINLEGEALESKIKELLK